MVGNWDTSRYRILVVDDDPDTRVVMHMTLERDGYQVFEANDGNEAIDAFQDIEPDVILMDAMMPELSGFDATEKILSMRGSDLTSIVIVTALHDDRSIERAFEIGAVDYITKPVQWSVLRHRLQRLLRIKDAEDALRQVIEDQRILHRIDRELGYTLNLDRVLYLASDTALRRTGASSCIIAWIDETTRQLSRLTALGGSTEIEEPIPRAALDDPNHPLSIAFLGGETIYEIQQDDPLYTRLIIPLIVRGKPEGIILLDGVMTGVYDNSDIDFLIHLGTRTAAAIEKTIIYQRGQEYILQMDQLHEVNVTIAGTLDVNELRHMSVRGVVVLLQGSSAFTCDYRPRTDTFTVRATHVEEGAPDSLPEVGTTFRLSDYPTVKHQFFDGVMQFQMSHADQPEDLKAIGQMANYQSGLLLPLVKEDEIQGLLVLGESSYERYFTSDDLALVRSFGVHVTAIAQQAELFAEVKELEQVKSEMIRMASHDLKNPLLQVKGYVDLLERSLKDQLTERQQDFVARIKSGADKMNSLVEDILNLERVESQRATSWKPFDARLVLLEVVGSLTAQADIRGQQFQVDILSEAAPIQGSDVQLKQAFTNLIGNAIKYTPDEGIVNLRAHIEAGEFHFEVEDTGYGIPEDRQARIFERFYRAYAPGTDHIPGTGLGLSLVKTIIQKHGGDVWFKSVEGEGSTFGFWLPLETNAATGQSS